MTAEAGTETFVEGIDASRVLALESIGFELFEVDPAELAVDAGTLDLDGPGTDRAWRWRVIDGDDRHLVTGEAVYESRRGAEAAADDVAGRLGDATVLEYGTPGYEVYPIGDGWRWRLLDDVDDVVVRQYDGDEGERAAVDTEDAARASAERTREVVEDADIVEFEGADYEVYEDDGEWRWRLVAADRRVLATSTEPAPDLAAAETSADRVREQALAADLVEFEQAAFQQYESDGEWRWRLIDEDGQVLADSGESYEDKAAVTEGMRTLKEHAPDAEVLEIDTAAFEIYRTSEAPRASSASGEQGDPRAGEYAWRLIDEAGRLIAESDDSHPSRAAAREAVDFLLEHVDEAAVRPMERAAFQLFADGDAWGFWLVQPDGTVLAECVDAYPTYDEATSAIAAVRAASGEATVDTVGAVAVQLREDSGWHWRLVDRDRETVARGERTYEDQEAAVGDVERLTGDAADAPIFDLGRGVVWVDRTDGGWRWRLVDEDRSVLAESPRTYESRSAVVDVVETVTSRAPTADTLDIDTLAFELYREGEAGAGADGTSPDDVSGDAGKDATVVGDGGEDLLSREDRGGGTAEWRWRLIDEGETVLATSAVAYPHRDAAEDAIEGARETTRRASIIEIDEVAFEFHERGDGWIWRLIDENGEPLAESVRVHDSRQDAREEMLAVKDHAPSGETRVT